MVFVWTIHPGRDAHPSFTELKVIVGSGAHLFTVRTPLQSSRSPACGRRSKLQFLDRQTRSLPYSERRAGGLDYSRRPSSQHASCTHSHHRESPSLPKVISELFSAGDPHLESNAVFGVKDSLLIDNILYASPEDAKKYGQPVPFYTLEYNLILVAGETNSELKFSANRS
jgi:hypothetical protein